MKVVIVGGGPAGSFCAIRLLNEAESAGTDMRVVLVESKPFHRRGHAGCNFCAGVITARTVERLKQLGIELHPGVIQRHIESYLYITEGGTAEFTKKNHGNIYSVFRGGGPRHLEHGPEESFDLQLLRRAEELGAEICNRQVETIEDQGGEAIVARTAEGDELQADLLVGAFGVNCRLAHSLQDSLGYTPPRSITACQAEIEMEEGEIDKIFGNRMFVFSLRHPSIRFLAATPKQHYVTLTAVGGDISHQQLHEYLRHPKVAPFFPCSEEQLGERCLCRPQMPVGVARGAVRGRFLAVGDAYVTRYYKNGVGSAFFTADAAARAIVHLGANPDRMRAAYQAEVSKRFFFSNRCGKLLFAINDLIYKRKWLSSSTLDYVQYEKRRAHDRRDLNNLMWSLFVGDRSYKAMMRRAFDPRLLARLFWWNIRRVFTRIGKWFLPNR